MSIIEIPSNPEWKFHRLDQVYDIFKAFKAEFGARDIRVLSEAAIAETDSTVHLQYDGRDRSLLIAFKSTAPTALSTRLMITTGQVERTQEVEGRQETKIWTMTWSKDGAVGWTVSFEDFPRQRYLLRHGKVPSTWYGLAFELEMTAELLRHSRNNPTTHAFQEVMQGVAADIRTHLKEDDDLTEEAAKKLIAASKRQPDRHALSLLLNVTGFAFNDVKHRNEIMTFLKRLDSIVAAAGIHPAMRGVSISYPDYFMRALVTYGDSTYSRTHHTRLAPHGFNFPD